MAGKTIKLYIYGEESKFLKSAELSNWSGKAFIGDRKNVPIIQKMDELSSPGIYFLINKDCPVISLGFSSPIISIRVGAMSARHPPSFKV